MFMFMLLVVLWMPISTSAIASPACVDQLADVPVEDLLAVRLDLVERARAGDSIQVMAYIFGDDDTGLRLLRAMIAASRRGVTVQLLLDGLGPGPLHPFSDELVAAIQALAPAFEIRIYHPKYQLWRLRHRMHDKLFLVGDTGVIGSSSVWDASARGWLLEKDILVQGRADDAGSVLASMHAHFARFWQSPRSVPQQPWRSLGLSTPHDEGNGGGKLDAARVQVQLERLLAQPHVGGLAGGWQPLLDRHCHDLDYIHDNDDKDPNGGASQAMMTMLAGARHEIVIVNPYVILTPSMHALLLARIRAGVRVRFVTTSIVSLAREFPAIAKAYADDLPALAAQGFEVAEFRGHGGRQMLHAKLVRVDGRSYYVGSFNFDPLSAWSNTENGLMITARGGPSGFTQALDAHIDDYLARSQVISDGRGRLLVPDAQRCDEVDCNSMLRWLAPLIRPVL